MTFTAIPDIKEKTATITLLGELDAASAPAFREAIETVAAASPAQVVLQMSGLEYMASAGLRVLIFAKQKMGTEIDIYVVAPQAMVLETLEKTGFDQSVIIVDQYNAA